jgi:hypothetical protein
MVDPGIKKVIIPSNEFPLVQFSTTKVAANILTISGNGTTITYTTTSPHNFLPGQRVKIVGVLPTSYNLNGALINAVPNTTSFTVLNSTAATYISGGIVEIYSVYDTVNNIFTIRDYVDELYYDFRYRIVSEDKNRFSHWSSIQRNIQPDVTSPFPHTEAARFSITSAQGAINAIWSFIGDSELAVRTALDPEDPSYISPKQANLIKFLRRTRVYDIWLRWNDENVTNLNDANWTPWEFETSVSSNNFSIRQLAGTKRIEIAIQVPTSLKVRDYYNNKLTLFRGISPNLS